MNDVAQTSFSGLRIDAATNEAGIYYGIPVVKFGAFKGIVLFRVKQEIFSQILEKALPPAAPKNPRSFLPMARFWAWRAAGSSVSIR